MDVQALIANIDIVCKQCDCYKCRHQNGTLVCSGCAACSDTAITDCPKLLQKEAFHGEIVKERPKGHGDTGN